MTLCAALDHCLRVKRGSLVTTWLLHIALLSALLTLVLHTTQQLTSLLRIVPWRVRRQKLAALRHWNIDVRSSPVMLLPTDLCHAVLLCRLHVAKVLPRSRALYRLC